MRFVAGQGALAACHREDVSGQGAAAEHHREAATAGKVRRATAGKEGRATAGKERYCWKGEILLERRTTAGKERSAAAGKKGLQGATGWSLFLMRPLCKLFLYL